MVGGASLVLCWYCLLGIGRNIYLVYSIVSSDRWCAGMGDVR